MRYERLKRDAALLDPTLWIGKGGLTGNIFKQLDVQLESRELVKVKVQKPLLLENTLEEISRRLQEETGSVIVEKKGRTLTLYKRRRREDKKA